MFIVTLHKYNDFEASGLWGFETKEAAEEFAEKAQERWRDEHEGDEETYFCFQGEVETVTAVDASVDKFFREEEAVNTLREKQSNRYLQWLRMRNSAKVTEFSEKHPEFKLFISKMHELDSDYSGANFDYDAYHGGLEKIWDEYEQKYPEIFAFDFD